MPWPAVGSAIVYRVSSSVQAGSVVMKKSWKRLASNDVS